MPPGGGGHCSAVSSAADVLIVGAGIAGCEAAWRCAHAGLAVVLVITNLDTVYTLASPAAALAPPAGSLMERSIMGAGSSPSTRSWDLHRAVKYELEATPGIHLLQSTVSDLLLDESGAVTGASTWEGVDRPAALTALCVGSFLRARLRSGEVTETHGRLSEMAYDDLYERLVALGFEFVPVRFTGPVSVTGEPFEGSVGYVVESVAFAPQERASPPDRPASAALWRVRGLFAAGVCVSSPVGAESAVEVSYEQVARQGMALGDELVATARASVGQSERGSV